MNTYIYCTLAILIGIALSIQTGVNSQLRIVLGNPIVATLIHFLVGTFALFMYVLIFQRQDLHNLVNLKGMAWYKWLGGLIGILYVGGIILIAPKLGIANTTALIVAGQIFFALILDHFGLLGFLQHPLNIMRLLGACLLTAGVVLILKN